VISGKNHVSEDARLAGSNKEYKLHKYTPSIIVYNMQFCSESKALSVKEISFDSISLVKYTQNDKCKLLKEGSAVIT